MVEKIAETVLHFPSKQHFQKVERLEEIAYSGDQHRADLMLFAGGSCADGSNWYAYCNNNPLMFVDPTGLKAETGDSEDYDDVDETKQTSGQDNNTAPSSPPEIPYAEPTTTGNGASLSLAGLEYLQQQQAKAEAQELTTTIDNVIYQPQYQEGYPTWSGQQQGIPLLPGAQPGVTWCNAAANAILVQSGAETSPILSVNPNTGRPDIGYTNANQMAANAVAAAQNPNSGVISVTPELAQYLANQGSTVLVVAQNPNPNASGHAGVVSPTSQQYDSTQGPMIAQTGTAAATGIYSAQESFMANGLEPRYYLIQRR